MKFGDLALLLLFFFFFVQKHILFKQKHLQNTELLSQLRYVLLKSLQTFCVKNLIAMICEVTWIFFFFYYLKCVCDENLHGKTSIIVHCFLFFFVKRDLFAFEHCTKNMKLLTKQTQRNNSLF